MKFGIVLSILLFCSTAQAQQPTCVRVYPQGQRFELQYVMRPAWPFGYRWVVRPILVPVPPSQQ